MNYHTYVWSFLKDEYDRRGTDFYFKTKKLERQTGISKYILGRVVMQLNCVEVVNRNTHSASTFKTSFGKL